MLFHFIWSKRLISRNRLLWCHLGTLLGRKKTIFQLSPRNSIRHEKELQSSIAVQGKAVIFLLKFICSLFTLAWIWGGYDNLAKLLTVVVVLFVHQPHAFLQRLSQRISLMILIYCLTIVALLDKWSVYLEAAQLSQTWGILGTMP